MTAKLDVAVGLALPLDAVTETFGLLAKRGAGKSNAAVRMAEQMHAAGLRWCAVDPKGDWWGIRATGTGPGLPVLVLGGRHGDLPLDPGAGKVVADLIADQNAAVVLDVSSMSKTQRRGFLADFAERLYEVNDEPLHVFAEEAHDYIPQRVTAGDARMVGAWETLVKWGRTRGIGCTLVTQRAASLNKDVLTQVETLIALRTTGPQDQAQIRSWVDEHDEAASMVAQLRSLDDGEAFVLSPHFLRLDGPLRVRFHRRRTFDSGATPAAGSKRPTAARKLAQVDVAAFRDALKAQIEQAEANDPTVLRRRMAGLERDLQSAKAEVGNLTGRLAKWDGHVCQVTEVPVLPPETVRALQDAMPNPDLVRMWAALMDDVRAQLVKIGPQLAEHVARTFAPPRPPRPQPVREPVHSQPAVLHTAGEPLPKAQRQVLTVLAQRGPSSRATIAAWTGRSANGGGFRNVLSALNTAGRITYAGQMVHPTEQGLADLGSWQPLPDGPDLLDHWVGKVGLTAGLILRDLAEQWPATATPAEVAERVGREASGGGFRNSVSKLRTLGLIVGTRDLQMAAELGEAISG